MFSRLAVGVLVLTIGGAIMGLAGAERPLLQGKLDDRFVPSAPVALAFAPVNVTSSVPRPPMSGKAWTAAISLPRLVSLPKGGTLIVGAVTRDGGRPTFYADLNLDGRLGDEERLRLRPWRDGVYAAHAILEVELAGPPARRFGIAVFVPEASTRADGAPELSFALGATVAGFATIDGRTVRVRLPFDLDTEKVDLDGYLGMDTDGDGSIDDRNVSNEYAYAPYGLPVFRVGNRYLSFASADYSTRRFALREHERADYKWIDLAIGKQVPDFAFTALDGRSRRLSQYRGKFLLLIYWDRLCGFAQEEVPYVNAAYARFKARKFEVIGLLDEDDPAMLADFVKAKSITWTNALPESTKELVRERFRFFSTPTCLLLDPSGRVVSRNQDGEPGIRGTALNDTLERLLPKD